MASSKKRVNFSNADKQYLVELVTDDINLIESKACDNTSHRKKIEAWKKIADLFNPSVEVKRTAKQLKTQWNELKRKAKNAVSLHKRLLNKTGGGEPLLPPSEIFLKIAELIKNDVEADNESDDDAEVEG